MRLLILTQKVDRNDDVLGFMHGWINEFAKKCEKITVICLKKGEVSLPANVKVLSLGKETVESRVKYLVNFYKYIFQERKNYDAVFVHMNPEYFTLGGWWWFVTRKPMYLWYTHYTMHMHLRLAGWLCKRMFAATKQSLPQYDHTGKKVVTGHGIDVDFWLKGVKEETPQDYKKLLTVHRICRSKRFELVIKSLLHLDDEYTVTIYGRDVEKDYYAELQDLVKDLHLEKRVTFIGPVPMEALKQVYGKHRLMVNMASETIDKTMLECMLFGLYPVTTPGNSEAIGLPVYPKGETPEAIAKFITEKAWDEYNRDYLQQLVKDKHSLPALISKMGEFIKKGM